MHIAWYSERGSVLGSVPVYCGAFKQVFAWEGFVQYWFSNTQEDTGQAAYIHRGARVKSGVGC